MNLETIGTSWRNFAEMVAPQQPLFNLIYLIIGYTWMACAATALFAAVSNRPQTPMLVEFADMLYVTTTMLILGGVLMGFYLAPTLGIVLCGVTVTFCLYRHFIAQAQQWLPAEERRSYMQAGMATVGVNGMCLLTVLAS